MSKAVKMFLGFAASQSQLPALPLAAAELILDRALFLSQLWVPATLACKVLPEQSRKRQLFAGNVGEC